MLLAFLTCVLLLCIGFWGHMAVQKELRQSLASQLETHLQSNREAVRLWWENQKRFVQSWAGEPWLQQALSGLIDRAVQARYRPELIKKIPELTTLRERLEPVVKRYEMIGFVVFDTTGAQVGALLDTPLGRRNLRELSDFVDRSLKGEAVVSVPFRGEVPLPDKDGKMHDDWPTMFVSAPVHGRDGSVIGVLAFRVRPEHSFTRVLEISHIGETGEAFAFNTEGYLLSAPRNNKDSLPADLSGGDPDETGILKVRLIRPPRSRNSGKPSSLMTTAEPSFTEMAGSALRRESGTNTEGYVNHRGKIVAGAWTWLEDANIGLAVEQEVKEAFAPLIAVRTVLFGIFTLLGLMTLVALVLRARQDSVSEKERRAQKALHDREEENQAIINNAVEGIITLESGGKILTVNPAAENMFAYLPGQLAGRNIGSIIPHNNLKIFSPSQQDDFLLLSGKAFFRARELMAVKENGEQFPVELTISTMDRGDERQFIGLIRDISEEKQAQKQLDHLNHQNKLILEAAGEGIFGVDLKGVVTFINPAGADLLGCIPLEIIGRPQHQLMRPLFLNGTAYTLRENPVHRVCADGEIRFVSGHFFCRKSGEHFPVEYTVKPIFEMEQMMGAVVVFRDISERMKAEQELVQYAGDLEKINSELTNFTSVATHDLQEPLRKVVTLADRLTLTNGSQLNSQGKHYLERIVSSVTRMQQLIVDLLEYSRTTSQQDSWTSVQLEDEIREALQVLEIQIEKTGARVECGPMPTLEGSAFQFRQLFQNLIGNALKFHRDGIPPVIRVASAKGTNGSWTLTVEDNGIGFDLRYLDRIFQPFRRLHRQEEFEGSGIGLAVCQKIVTLHHGVITAESEVGQGTRFLITLPEKQPGG
ncbi:MAG: PAS domain S-box protein [Nitrospina sp.]|nr:PAS domain S-box protein [Nitrospina sp.]